MPQKISPWDILTSGGKHDDREKDSECTSETRMHAADLAERVSKLLDHLNVTATVSSGFRTSAANAAANGAKNSAHCTGQAVDLEDRARTLSSHLNSNPDLLDQFDLYMENIFYTPTWCHLQTRPTASGRRIFTP